MFASSFSNDQHGHSGYLWGTACYAFSDENKTTVTAAQRPNMSTASLERTDVQRKRGSLLHILLGTMMHIMHILHILHI